MDDPSLAEQDSGDGGAAVRAERPRKIGPKVTQQKSPALQFEGRGFLIAFSDLPDVA